MKRFTLSQASNEILGLLGRCDVLIHGQSGSGITTLLKQVERLATKENNVSYHACVGPAGTKRPFPTQDSDTWLLDDFDVAGLRGIDLKPLTGSLVCGAVIRDPKRALYEWQLQFIRLPNHVFRVIGHDHIYSLPLKELKNDG